MIPFFRKIRKTLADDNKPLKYLRYAIGEIVLVVIGILIAVQLNNWNESRKQKLVEIDVLKGIRNDILKDTVDLNFNIRAYSYYIKQDSVTLNHLVNKKVLDQRLVKSLMADANADWSILLHDSHFEEVKQKGLSIISNLILRETISKLYEFDYKFLILAENSRENFDHSNHLRTELGQYFGYDSTGIIINNVSYDKLLSNSNTLYYIKQGEQNKKSLLSVHESTLEFALKVVDSINKELTKLKKK